jgi:hypothetical protein
MRGRMKRRLRPRPPDSPAGYVYFYWKLMPIEDVEAYARRKMGNHDRLPRKERDLANYRPGGRNAGRSSMRRTSGEGAVDRCGLGVHSQRSSL